tara:strand:- start:6764 stop:8056 length:1293 start_codon:yes stop_codon:yes gene_type:complete
MTKSKVNNKNQKGGLRGFNSRSELGPTSDMKSNFRSGMSGFRSGMSGLRGGIKGNINSLSEKFKNSDSSDGDFQKSGDGLWNTFRWDSLSDTGASDASAYMTPSGTGFFATFLQGAGGFCNTVFTILSYLEKALNIVFLQAVRLEPFILKSSYALYLWKFILLIGLIVIAITDLAGGASFDKESLQVIYSVCKGINVIIIFIATLVGAAKVGKRIEDKNKLNKQTNTTLKYPFPLLLVGYIISALPILYELLSLVALSSIVLAYYTVKCTGATPNTESWVETISNLLMLVGGMGLVLSFLQFRIKKSCGTTKDTTELQGPTILMLTSLSYFIVLLITLGFEQMVSDNVMYWMNKSGGGIPGTDCVKEQPEDGFKSTLNLVLSILITTFLVIIIIIGVMPPLGPLTVLATLNDRARTILKTAVDYIFKMLI